VAAARVARMASIDPAGRPHLVPIVFALRGDHLYSAVDAKPKRSPRLQRLANIRANPLVTILVDHYEEDWARLWWVRIRGAAGVLEEGSAFDEALQLLAAKYRRYRERAPEGPVVEVTAEEWLGWSA
jgi:PPOX class probable F420-dependent enzyme